MSGEFQSGYHNKNKLTVTLERRGSYRSDYARSMGDSIPFPTIHCFKKLKWECRTNLSEK